MKTTSVSSFIDQVVDRAETMFKETGELSPMYHAIDATGLDVVFPAPPFDKDKSIAVVRTILAKIGATRVAFIGEGWMLDARANVVDIDKVNREGVHADPRRIEVIMITIEDVNEGLVMAMREIIRCDDEVTLGKLEIQKMGSVEGRMVGLLPSPVVKH